MQEYTGALAKYLVRRGKKGRFYLRLAVPRPLHAAWGMRERVKALGTSDRDQAERQALPILAHWREEERQALGQGGLPAAVGCAPSMGELEHAAVAVGYDLVREHEERRLDDVRGQGMDRWRRQVERTRINTDTQSYMTATRDFSLVQGVADAAIEEFGFDLAPGSDGYAQFCELLNSVRLTALMESQARAIGKADLEIDNRVVRRVRDREAAAAKPGQTIMELFELWAAECLAIGDKREDTVNQERKRILQFAEFVGKDRAVELITPLEVAEYRDLLRQLPPKWSSKNALAGLSLHEAAAKARTLDLPMTKFTTVNSHLSTISPLYKWLAKHPSRAGLVNPCNNLFFDKVKGRNPRPPFSTDHINAILKSPLFTGFLADGKEHLPGNAHADDWRKWVPLVCMWTGARLGEVAQLRIGDVQQQHDVWFVYICEDNDAGLATKSRKNRPAAVHSMLERLGFISFVEKRREAAGGDLNSPLFPELEKNSRGQISGKVSRWWRNYLSKIGVKLGADGTGAHSFRHTLADRYRSEAEMLDDEIEVALGHNQKTVTSGYGRLPQGTVKKFRDWIEAIRFEGVDFAHLQIAA